MNTLALIPANDDFSIRTSRDVVSSHLRARRLRRNVVTSAACMAALVLSLTVYVAYETTRPMPDMVTFAFRV